MKVESKPFIGNDSNLKISLPLKIKNGSNSCIYEKKEFTEAEAEYWGKGISKYDLEKQDIYSLLFFEDHRSSEANYVFGIFAKGKLRRVLIPHKNIKHNLCIDEKHIEPFGFNNLPSRKVKYLMITANERDVVNLQKAGFHAIYFNCKLSDLPELAMSKLLFKCKNLYLNLGLGNNSIHETIKLIAKYSFLRNIKLPDSLKQYKDSYTGKPSENTTDYFRHYSKVEFDSLVDTATFFSEEIVLEKSLLFWKEKKNKNGDKKIQFLPGAISNFLAANGIFEYGFSERSPRLIKIRGYSIENISVGYVYKLLRMVSKEFGDNEVLNSVIIGLRSFSDKKLCGLLDSKRELEFYNGEINSQLFLYKGVSFNVTKTNIEKIELTSIKSYIKKDETIPFFPIIEQDYYKIHKTRSHLNIKILNQDCDFLRFLQNTSSIYWNEDNKTADMIAKEDLHLISKISIIGYLCTIYRKPSELYSVFLYDYSCLYSSKANGGTGKSILAKALSLIVSTEEFDGQDRQLLNKDTGFSRVTEKTKLVVLDDVHSEFNIKLMFAKITGRFSLRNRYQDARILPDDQSIKFIFTTNNFYDLSDKSKDRRSIGAYFSDYYEHKRMTPKTEFGYDFFSNQEPYEQRNRFYNFMMQCVKTYFEFGLIEAKVPDIKIKLQVNKIGKDYLEWANEYFETYEFGERICRSEFDDSFLNYISKMDAKMFSKRQLKDKLKFYCELHNYELNPEKNGGIIRSNSKEYYRIVRKDNLVGN
jgi:hypothetical protein